MLESWLNSTSQKLSSFVSTVEDEVNSLMDNVTNSQTAEEVTDVGKAIGEFFDGVSITLNEIMTKTTSPEEDRETFTHVKHFGEIPGSSLKPIPTKYVTQNLRDELFDDEWSAFLRLKSLPCSEGFSDRFLMACLFSRKLDVQRTETMLLSNRRWREENGFSVIPEWESLDKNRLVEGRFILKIPGTRARNGEGIIYIQMGKMFPQKWPGFTETCINWAVWNGMHGGLYEGMDYFRNGMVMIIDMSQVGWNNIDLSLQTKMGSVLLDNFPMRTCKILILNPPWILNTFLSALHLVLKKKLIERIFVMKDNSELLVHVSEENLHENWGGNLHYHIEDWFEFCREQDSFNVNVEEDSSSSLF
eukprot:TRINITY_DN2791_c0_g2_i10.p1 TRINITY_DN2791_c0_g2~~TRINITY_DN2791_c0_g2_i10.p1  ORF type:complete len:360 (+),score=56.81 TRINITY_DN2791_c0_g2_i10:78-1157(+)